MSCLFVSMFSLFNHYSSSFCSSNCRYCYCCTLCARSLRAVYYQLLRHEPGGEFKRENWRRMDVFGKQIGTKQTLWWGLWKLEGEDILYLCLILTSVTSCMCNLSHIIEHFEAQFIHVKDRHNRTTWIKTMPGMQ